MHKECSSDVVAEACTRFQRKAPVRFYVAETESLEGGPRRAMPEAVEVRSKLPWTP